MVYRDAEYPQALVVELDGRLFHDTAEQRDSDFERDLDAAVDGRATTRISWGQVFGRPCSTAGKVAKSASAAGLAWSADPCGPDCTVA
ncbi:hypothetical protein [Nocardioides sp. InS609-2]|uniref:hypothetical protein n=1 Tax=Nocardioides sp. InS609-2 TaxID=2760705 RepID=UPI0020BF8C97|nr:hypothetical protein [Nocardioides sp. InS609-2]